MKTGRYSLKNLLTHNEIEQIIIPEIQRDYVWQDDNVKKLLDDIFAKFQKKENLSVEIRINGKAETKAFVNNFLAKEYEKLKFNVKLGFIYAYHDRDYAGKFFLIDGQQRLTTLFLFLLFLYKKSKKGMKTFKELYFKNNRSKLDYKVREQTHDFLKLLIESEIKGEDYSNSRKFYNYNYLKDTTIQNLINNYNSIQTYSENFESYDELLEYVEDFVEVNYFDTHLSEQGEQLYIYMNSRGEQLSSQEILRAEIIKKEHSLEEKIQLGKSWEKWQNFFWKNRGKNENADIGFEEFLKWVTILHFSVTGTENLYDFIGGEKKFSLKELKENYIKIYNDEDEKKKQKIAFSEYQKLYLNHEFVSDIFDVIEQIFSMQSGYIPLQKKWLSSDIKTLDYVVLLPLILYCYNNRKNKLNNREVERIAMFLKNISNFESVAKNPDEGTLNSLYLVNLLKDSNFDIVSIHDDSNVSESILTVNEKQKLNLFRNEPENRIAWEDFFWNITLNDKLSDFLMGDSFVIFKSLEKLTELECSDKIDFCNNITNVLENVILENRDQDILRQLILTKFDYLQSAGTGNSIEKYSFIGIGNSWEQKREWKNVIINEHFIELLFWLLEKDIVDIEKLFEMAKSEFTFDDYREAFIDVNSLLKYCSNKKILWDSEHHITLLSATNYSEYNSREIQCALLKDTYKNKYMWVHKNNCCVLDVDLQNENIVHLEKMKGNYALDLQYDAIDKKWNFTLFNRNDNLKSLTEYDLPSNWDTVEDRISPNQLSFFHNSNISLLENNRLLSEIVEKLIIETETLLKTLPND